MSKLQGTRKFVLATLSLFMAFTLTVLGKMSGNEFFLTAGLILGLYSAGNVAEHKIKHAVKP